MILKGGQVATALRKSDSQIWCALVFGDDDGVVTDTAESITESWKKQAGGPCKTVNLDDDDIKREPHILADNIETASLLGDVDIVRVRTNGEKIAKTVLSLVEDADKRGEPFANRLLILSSGLNKRSKLRSGFEAAKLGAAIHVFADTAQSMSDMVRARLDSESIEINDDALHDFVALLPGHRGLANQETEKLALFGHGLDRPIAREDVKAVSQTDADSSVRDMVTAALDGEDTACLAELDRVLEIGTSAISILRLFEMETKRLLEARSLVGTGGDIGRKLKPPVWQNEWPAFRSRMDRWSAPSLVRLLAAIHDLELQAKTQGPAAEPAIRIFILNVIRSVQQRARTNASR